MDKIKLNQIGDIYRGKYIVNQSLSENGDILYLGGKHIQNDILEINQKTNSFLNELEPRLNKFLSQEGDIVVSSLWEKRKIYSFKKDDPECFISQSWFLIRSERSDYLSKYFKIEKFRKKFEIDCQNLIKGSIIPNITLNDFKEIEIFEVTEEALNELSKIEKNFNLNEEELYKSLNINKLNNLQKDFISNLIRVHYEDPIVTLTKEYESLHLEFKSTFKTDIENNGQIPKEVLIHEVIKTIGGFCNVSGGDLLIGVSDNNEIIGIEKDNFKNQDQFYKSLTETISSGTKPDVMNLTDVINITFHQLNERTICRINVKPTKEDIFVKKKKEWFFYMRKGPQTVPLRDMELVEYVEQKRKIYQD